MTVKELIRHLKKMPKNAKVKQLWDGEARTEVNIIYLARNGEVITADYEEQCYSTESRPPEAPTFEVDNVWQTIGNPNEL